MHIHESPQVSQTGRPSSKGRPRALLALAATSALALGLSGCAAGDGSGSSSASTELDHVSIVLDWTPNTNHTGIFVAQQLGYYEDAGLDVEVLPYSSAGVESVVASGGADFGISGALSVTQANAQGEDLTMVMNIQQKSSSGVAYRADDTSITSPKDLDGKLFASWGGAELSAQVTQMIRNDGGEGTFESVTLGTSAYDAVYSGTADFAQGLTTWEGIEAELAGTPLNFFLPADYGVTATPAEIGISTTRDYLSSHSDVVQRFAQATQKGYQYAVDNPDEAGDILIEQNPSANLDTDLVHESQELLSSDYWPDADGSVGHADLDAWQQYVDYLVSNGLLTDENGATVTEAPDVSDLVTNNYLS